MEKRIIPGYVHYLNQKHNIREWDDETIGHWYGRSYERMVKHAEWSKKARLVFLNILLVLLFIASFASIGCMAYHICKVGAYECLVFVAVPVCLYIAFFRSERKKSHYDY